MLSTAVMSFFGFFFWIINARLYKSEDIGIATTLISVMTLISSFSLLGLNFGLVRYLSKLNEKNEKINSSFIITTITATLISVAFLLGLEIFSPRLLFLHENFVYVLTFIFFVIVISLNFLVESIFLAYRSTKYIFIKNTLMSVIKVVLPFFLVIFNAYGIYTAVGIAGLISLIVSVILLIQNFEYKPQLVLNFSEVRKISSYSFSNYFAGFLNILPIIVLPIFITNTLGVKESAYFYMAMMIANLLFIIPQSISQSLFAEGSYSEEKLGILIVKATKIIFVITIPSILITIMFGNYILLAFGKEYSAEAFRLLQLMAVSCIFVSINSVYSAILKVKDGIKELIWVNLLIDVIIFLLCFLLSDIRLSGIGFAWIVAQAIGTCIYFLNSKRVKYSLL